MSDSPSIFLTQKSELIIKIDVLFGGEFDKTVGPQIGGGAWPIIANIHMYTFICIYVWVCMGNAVYE